jgi:glycosyltransferase involved in cell wall biosynthesis
MNIIHITNISNNKASGISLVVPHHIKWQSRLANVFWYNLNDKYIPPKELKNIYCGVKDHPDYKIGLLPQPFCNPDLVIFHGIYFYKYCILANELVKRNIPYIVVPHGSLTDLAIKKKALKKKIGFILLFKRFLKNARAIQYLTEGEHEASGDKWNASYVIIPNGCEIPTFQKTNFRKENLVGSFIGRKSIYYKGLDLLIEACYRIKKDLEKNYCKIHIYGPDDNGSTNELNKSIEKYGLNRIVFLHEGIYDEEKRSALIDSDFFILTSRTEGHPVALIEALSYGVPALVTTGTNMADEIIDFNAGWVAETNFQSIAKALMNLLENADNLSEYSKNAYKLSLKYEWSFVAKEAIETYEYLISNT